MLIHEKFNTRLIDRFRENICIMKYFHMVVDGRENEKKELYSLSSIEADRTIKTFMEADYAWIGIRHREPMGYHFAIKKNLIEKEAHLVGYIDCINSSIISHLEVMLDYMYYEKVGIDTLIVPFYIEGESDKSFVVASDKVANLTKVHRIGAA